MTTKPEHFSYEERSPSPRPSPPYLFSGARPSPGAAASKARGLSEKSSALELSELAAPEDGRAPLNTYSSPGEGEVFERLGVVTVQRLLPTWPLISYRIGTAKRVRAAFTLVEVLAALAFMAIVIPVAVDGLRIANRAGQVGQRKAVAARVAERVLNEVVITGQFRSTTQSGTVQEGVQAYQWFMRSEPWPMDAMLLVTVQVNFPVQGREFDVRLSTLVNNSTQ